ncbi:MAG TPA: AAA family ATPase [Flavipsychrobacter sp.]|nr:AAA family ATPase [Flavipsychrobacter sp.]
METKRITRHIDRLLLDPNNYRFIDRADYKLVLDDQLADERVQQRTFNFLLGKNNDNIRDLQSSFTTNGFLDIDQIQVKAVGDKYLVLEGNRRVATLKHLYEEFKKGNDVGKLLESDFKSVNLVEIIGEDAAHHLITMGLHHISGKKRWSAVNEAQLISDLIYKYKKSEDEVCESLGISKYKLRKSVRALSLIEQYKASDFGDQFKTDMYSIFESVIGNPVIKQWLGWSDDDYYAYNDNNLQRFFTWISRTEEVEHDENGVEQSIIKEPIISQYRQIKELSEFINDEKAVKKMEESRSLVEGYTYSDAIGEARLRNALNNIKSEVQTAFNFSEYMTTPDYEQINKLKDKLDRLIPTSQAIFTINEKKSAPYFQTISKHFEELNIVNYRKLSDVNIKHLSKVNIFAGGNNMGKTSILEAFYLLTQLNDINVFLDLEKYRGKFYNGFHSKWIDKNFISTIDISGTFNDIFSSLLVTKDETTENIEKTSYLSTIKAEATVNGNDLLSSIHLYGNREPELRYLKSQMLCQASFTSPYRYNGELLRKAHAYAVQEKFFDEVIDFIRLHLDNSIEKIELVSDEGESRFLVTSSSLDKVIDITKYGEGLQRIFEIALLMCYNNNGILCIDEIDSAVHKGLLVDFTRFIQESAERFNVQVFLSTHSKECIDAFVENGYPDKELTAFALNEENGKIVCKYLEGNKLQQLVESINLDIR